MLEDFKTDAEALITQVKKPELIEVCDVPHLLVPHGYNVLELSKLLPIPTRKTAQVDVSDSDSFIAYTKRHGSLAECVIYVALESDNDGRLGLISILNDDGEEHKSTGWRDHTCTLEPKKSVEWRRWLGNDKKEMTQGAFATFIEDNLSDIASVDGSPSGISMLQMALAFETNAEKRLRSAINLQDGGVRMEFVDDATKDTSSSMDVFKRFHIAIPVFDGSSSAYPLEARLKYRTREGSVKFWFELIRSDRVFKTAAKEEIEKIKAATGFPLIFGKP